MGGHAYTGDCVGVPVMGWVMLVGGGLMAVIPGMFQVVNGATVWGILLALAGATVLVRNEGEGA